MSTTVDNRVVEMRFDNKQFESGVATSMSTLDKLKQKLNLSGASKGLENISSAAKNVSFAGMNSGIDVMHAKFSALQVMGVTALANITNSAVNAGKRITKALTIDPIKTGFEEYELKMNSVQTIMSNTASKGTTMSDVTRTLEELNTYADKTIYNFAEMTRNIGTFTAAGVGLEESASAIKGIANLAAASGSSSQQASVAMYQLSQALAAGTVKLMDWNSVVNAGMGGEKFQEALKATAREHGVAVDAIIEKNGSFRDSLQEGWISADILNETLNKFTVDGAKNYAQSMMESGKWTKEQADALIKEAQSMEDAATKVKTFTQLFDTMKESVQSGWAQTWEILIGDFEEAKELFSGLSDFFGKFISKSADTRNKILDGALSGNPFTKLAERIEKVTSVTDKMADATKKVTDATKDYNSIVNKIIGGEFGNGESRIKALTEAGYDWAHAQNLVNEKLGDSTRHATDYKESQEQLSKSQNEVSKAQKTTIEDLLKMSDAQLKNLGFTKDEVEAFRELEDQSKKTGIPIKDLMKDLDQLNGRTLLINSFKNAGQGLVAVFTSVGKAWKEAFYGDASDEDIIKQKTESLYNAIAAIHKFSTYLKVSDETADKLTRTFKGLFAIVDIITTIVGGGFKLAFKGLSKILGAFDMNILDLTANLGDAIVAFRDFLFDNQLVNKGFELLAIGIKKAADAFKNLIDAIGDIPQVKKFIDGIKDAINDLQNVDLTEVGKNIIEGLQNGLGDGVKEVWNKMVEIGQGIIDAIKDVLGIHSPSRVMMAIGGFIISGLILGLKLAFPDVWDAIIQFGKDFYDRCRETFNDISWDKIFAGGVAVAMIYFVKQISDAIGGIANAFDGIGDMFEGVASVLTGFDKVLKGFAWDMKAKAMKKMAVAIAILVGAVVVLTQFDTGKLWNSVGIIVALSAVMGVLAYATDKMSDSSVNISKGGASIEGMKSGLLAIGASMLLLAATVKIVGNIDTGSAIKGFVGLTLLMGEMILFMKVCGEFVDGESAKNIHKVGSMMLKLSVALILMVGVCKLVSGLSGEEMLQGAVFATAFVAFVIAITAIAKSSGKNVSKVGGLMIKLAIAMGLMIGVVKMVGLLSAEDMLQGVVFAGAFALFVKVLVSTTKMGVMQQTAKIGGMMLGISTSLLLMIGVCKLVGTLSTSELVKGISFITAFIIFINVMVNITKIGSDQKIAKVSATMIALSIAVGILAAVSITMSLIELSGLVKGISAVALLGGVMTAMIWATKGANDVKNNLIVMTVAIGLMTASVAALSLIDGSKLLGASTALGMLMGMFALIAKSTGTIGKSVGALTTMTLCVGALAGILYLLSGLEVNSTIEIAASLSLLMLSLGKTMKMISHAGAFAGAAIGPMAALSVITGLVGLMLVGLTKLNPGPTLEIATSMSEVILAMSAAALLLSRVGPLATMALPGAAGLMALISAFAGGLALLGGLVGLIPGANEFLQNGIPILEKIGMALGAFFGGIVEGFSSAVLNILPKFGIALSNFMIGLQPFIVLASKVDSSVLSGIGYISAAILALTAANLISGISKFLSFGQSFSDLGKQLTDFIINANPFLIMIRTIDPTSIEAANTLAKMILTLTAADLVSGISKFISIFSGGSSFEDLGKQLTSFGKAVVSFSSEIKGKIDPESVEAAANAGMAMSKLANAIPRSEGFLQDIIGEQDLEKFGDMCLAFGKAIKRMSMALTGEGGTVLINEDAINAAVKAGKGMSKLANSIPKKDGFLQDAVGTQELDNFGVTCESFGYAIKRMSTALTGEGGASLINEAAINSAVNAGKGMSKLANSIPKKEGFLQDVVGTQDLENFGLTCEAFGKAIKSMSSSLTGEKGNVLINEAAINSAVNAGKLMTELQKAIPDDKWFDGKVPIDDFGAKIKRFGMYIAGYGKEVADIDSDKISSSANQAKKLVGIAKIASEIDPEAMGKFKNISIIADGMKSYSDKVKDIDAGKVSSSVTSAIKLKNLINSLAGIDNSGIYKFNVSPIGNSIKSYSSSVTGMNYGAVSMSIIAIKQLIGTINSMAGLNTSGVGSFASAINSLSKVSISGVIKAFSGASSKLSNVGRNLIDSIAKGMKSRQSSLTSNATNIINSAVDKMRGRTSIFESTGKILMTNFISGIRSQNGKVASATTASLNSAVNKMRSYHRSFYNAGSYLVSGFASGISANSYKASAKAAAMASAAYKAAKNRLDINSPSKVFRKLGYSVPEGFAQGIDRFGRIVKRSSMDMADTAIDGTKRALSRVARAVDGDMDVQPTIRPVLDLSDIKSGAGAINGLLGQGSTIGVSANVNAVSSMMNQRTQNSSMDEVVSAINKLRKDLSNIGNTSYTINGVTYDDGSNISDAVKALVRAARVERRI